MNVFLNIQELNTILETLRMDEEGRFSVEDLFDILNNLYNYFLKNLNSNT